MAFPERGGLARFESKPVEYLYRFDKGVWFMHPERGAPYMMILFPSRLACPLSRAGPDAQLYVNVVGVLWLPFYATRDEGFREARDWGKYRVERAGDETLEVWGHSPELFRVKNARPSHVLVRYDNEERHMIDVRRLLDATDAVDELTTLKTRFIESDEPPEARRAFVWSGKDIMPVVNGMD